MAFIKYAATKGPMLDYVFLSSLSLNDVVWDFGRDLFIFIIGINAKIKKPLTSLFMTFCQYVLLINVSFTNIS